MGPTVNSYQTYLHGQRKTDLGQMDIFEISNACLLSCNTRSWI